ncbi:anthranilate synthase component I family protein [Psychrobacter sp. FBL11]|uniref:Anthranilate synthase component I family protein n=1 Tax=Psychrobacter saeujeotis TaxID=3143436 RepID=A0ABU9XB61_9GAMM|nr:anthranilate synthase component I family protein [uncultured Psychrobacter sp.]
MLAPNAFQDTTKQTHFVQTPAIKNSWRFGELSATELLPKLQQHLLAKDSNANWQLVWLNNDGHPVIGLLPKVSWSVYPAHNQTSHTQPPTYKVIKHCRNDENAVTTAYMSYTKWQDELIVYSRAHEANNTALNSLNTLYEKPNYHHGLVGFIGYDIAAHELSPAAKIELAAQPCAVLGHYDIYLTQSVINKAGWTLNTIKSDVDSPLTNLAVAKLISYLDALDLELSNIKTIAQVIHCQLTPLILNAQWHKRDYYNAFRKTQDYLQQGDCYQINLTQAWQGCLHKLDGSYDNNSSMTSLIDYLPALYQNTQAPFAGYLGAHNHLDDEKPEHLVANNHTKSVKELNNSPLSFEILSCSPELFFTFINSTATGSHHIITKPIKGTRPRGSTDKQDLMLKQQLIDSDKDRAENVMIVDLLRNDLGKYAKTGSVKVPHLFAIESFSNVHHMVSTITAELRVETHPLAVLFGSLPAGSITGTPKKRAVEIISELETAPRGAYCGTMGYMNFDGSGQWNVLIRTLQANNLANTETEVSLWAGGGITVASDLEEEYQECLDKVGNLLNVLNQSDII